MELIRIGDKLLSRKKAIQVIDAILDLRSQGYSQQEVARRLNLDRPFVSHLEKVAEVRKGTRVAVIGFPVSNKEELAVMLEQEGVDYWLLMNDEERWAFARNMNGLDFFNKLMEMVALVRTHDVVVFIGSNYRIRLVEALLDREVVGVELGESPIKGDKYVDPEKLRELIRSLIKPGEVEGTGEKGN